MNIGVAIRYLRRKKRWTQSDLAERIFTTKSNVSSLENKNHGYSPMLLSHLAKAFECKVSYIFALAEQLSAEQGDVHDVSIEILFSRLPIAVQNKFKDLILELLKFEDEP